ncbi:MAG: integral membrane glycosyltransferase [Acidobacteria bacterium]|nr:MAG: integral membrane glycosyltransferase [Acidobacteriota bacterium]
MRMRSARAWLDASEVFRHRRARPVARWERWLLGVLLFLGAQSVVLFALWWFRRERVGNPVLFALLSIATWYGISRIVIGWYNAFHIEQPPLRDATPGHSVAIFITSSPGEPYAMFERTLAAAAEVRYPHTTYLLDDTRDPRIAALAAQMHAVHLELIGIPGAKAGKINAALRLTTEELILVLDPDHVPFPEFLDRVVGYFDDAGVGFVQVAQAYYNAPRSFVARAAAEQTFAFYGPILQGMHGTGTAVAIGANCTFRRTALESIGGHGIGLAEDLVTAIRLHAAGWKSVYVPEVVARGLVPEDLDSYLRQQLKWARGVYEVLLREYPRAFRRLTMHQRIAYLMVGTYYLVGLTTPIYLLIPLLYLLTGLQPATMFLADYLLRAFPVGLFGVLIYRFVQRWLCDPVRERGWHWRGMLLKIGCWSVYLKGLLFAIGNVAVPYIPTSKERRTGNFRQLAAVPLSVVVLSVAVVLWAFAHRLFSMPEAEVRMTTEASVAMSAFALFNALLMSGRLYAAWKDSDRNRQDRGGDISSPSSPSAG